MESPPRSAAFVAFSGLTALAVAMGIGRFAFTPVLPMMQSDGLVTLVGGGWLASANYIGYFAGALSAMFVRFSAALAIRVALLLIAVTTIAMAFDHRMAMWILHRFIAGVASAWVLVFGSAWAMERLAALSRPTLGGFVFSGVGVGIAAAGLVCLVLMQLGTTSTTAWTVLGVIAAIFAALVWPSFSGASAAVPPSSEPWHFHGGEFLRLTLCYGALGFGYIVPATFLPAMARDAIPDPAVFGWAWPIFGAAAAISTLVAAAIARSIGYRWLWIAANLVMAAGVAIPLASSGVGALLASGLLVGGTFMVITMAGLQEARRIATAKARELIAAMTCAFALGQILGPILVSFLVHRGHGYPAALAAAAAALVLSSIALFPWRTP